MVVVMEPLPLEIALRPPAIGTWGVYLIWLNNQIAQRFGGGGFLSSIRTVTQDGRQIQVATVSYGPFVGYMLIDVTGLRAWIPTEMVFQQPYVVPVYIPYGSENFFNYWSGGPHGGWNHDHHDAKP